MAFVINILIPRPAGMLKNLLNFLISNEILLLEAFIVHTVPILFVVGPLTAKNESSKKKHKMINIDCVEI